MITNRGQCCRRLRHDIADPGRFAGLRFGLRRDDGAVIHVNGSEVYRDSNVPAGAGYSTYATGLTPSETAYQTISVPASSLVAGDNVIAVEVHQESSTSSDLHFDLDARLETRSENGRFHVRILLPYRTKA